MRDLDGILNRDTLLRTANGNVPTGQAPPATLPDPDPASETENYRKPIWHFKLDPHHHGRVTDLTCLVRDMGFMKMTVCESIEWHDVIVGIGGRNIRLPLQSEFLVVDEYLRKGKFNGSSNPHALWQLPMLFDQSFQKVFCYDLGPLEELRHQPPGPAPALKPVPPSVLDSPRFMPLPYNPITMSQDALAEAACGTMCTLYAPNLYVVVVMSLVCCKERDDFDPGGALQGGRFYPLFQIMSNHPVDRLDARITHRRPARLPPGHENMDGERMLPEIGSLFCADNNDRALPVPVVWTHGFSYYDDNPKPGRYVMVDYARAERKITGATAHATVKSDGPFGFTERVEEEPVELRKVHGQGEFDNLHIAPRMVAPDAVRAIYKHFEPTLGHIAMAPFCVHDCFHTHVRWSAKDKAKQACGWDGYKPYAKPGAPLVPPNQRVEFELLAPNAFDYIATVLPNLHLDGLTAITAGQWQTINHHGSAYALATNLVSEAALRGIYLYLTVNNEPVSHELAIHQGKSWAMLYWHMRYTMGRLGAYAERVRLLDAAKARA